MVSTAQLCIYCKGGRNLCGLGRCPLLNRVRMDQKIKEIPENGFFGPAPSIFVGRFGYPNIMAGPTGDMGSTLGENPGSWFGKSYDEIIEKRSFVLRSKYKQNIFSRSRFVEDNQLLAMAKKPTDVEMDFRGKPVYRMSFSDMVQPMGPSVSVNGVRIAENVRVQRIVEKVVSDEMKANDSAFVLYKKNVDIYKLTAILSSGALGLEKIRKMVPTRWSITATDDIIAKNLIKSMRTFPSINEYRVYESEFLNNRFVVLLMPGSWEFENFEAWKPGSFWSFNLKKTEIVEDYEPFEGKKGYSIQSGGYYSSRFSICQFLNKIKKQARVIVFREVYEGYVIPLGVWVVRETSKNAFKNPCVKFSNLKDALNHIRQKLKLPLEEYMKRSRILSQKRLNEFIR